MIIVDRIEGDFAVVYFGGLRRDIPLSDLPEGVREGSVLVESTEGWELDLSAEKERRQQISERTHRIFRNK